MKRVKKANIIIKKYKVEQFEVECPHCKTILMGFDRNVLRLICYHCDNPIELNWEVDDG